MILRLCYILQANEGYEQRNHWRIQNNEIGIAEPGTTRMSPNGQEQHGRRRIRKKISSWRILGGDREW